MNGFESVVKNLLERYPVGIPFEDAAIMLGYKSRKAAYTARARGSWPVTVCRLGAGLTVRTSDLLDYLKTGERQGARDMASRPVKKGIGRPTKTEQVEAQRRGLTVRELRAIQD